MSDVLRMRLCNIVKEWQKLGVVYEHRGITRKGCDCTGLVIGVLKEMGYLKIYKLRNYPPDWNLHAKADNFIVEELSKVAYVIETPSIGDLVLFYLGKCVAHVGVVIENSLFIHCHRNSKKCVISNLWNSEWTKRIFCFYRLDECRLNGFWMG